MLLGLLSKLRRSLRKQLAGTHRPAD